jgi:hypothetical protein
MAAAALIVVVGGGAFAFSRYYRTPAAIGASMGTLVVESTPPGVPVVIDGEARGVTPVSVSLRAGDHVLELRGSGSLEHPADRPAVAGSQHQLLALV